MNNKPVRVLFVCLGNICRSPMAEAVFAHKVALAGLSDEIDVDSAGTDGWHIGSAPHAGTRRVLQEGGIACSHIGRAVSRADFDNFDYILAMDQDNIDRLRQIGSGTAVVKLLLSFTPDCGANDVPDPYYTGNFDEVYRLIDAAAENLLAWIRKEHGL